MKDNNFLIQKDPNKEICERKYSYDYLILKLTTIFIGVNVVLVLFGYDSANLNQFVIAGNLFSLGINPYSLNVGMVMGYFSMPFYTAIYYVYSLSDFNIIITFVSVKIISAVTYYLVALLLYLTIKGMGKGSHFLLFVFMMNPFFFLYNDIETVDTIFPLLYVFLGYVLLTQYQTRNRFASLIGTFFILISAYTLYFTILIIPSIIIYRSENKGKLSLTAFFILLGLFLYIPISFLHVSSEFANMLVSVGSNPTLNSSFYSIFWLFGPLPTTKYWYLPQLLTGVIVIASFIVPIIVKKLKMPVAFSIYIVLQSSFMIEFTGVTPDLYLYSFTFLVLTIAYFQRYLDYRKMSLLGLISFIPLAIVQQFYWGLDGTTGLFYYLFPTTHQYIALYNLISAQFINQLISLLIIVNAFIIISIIFIILSKRQVNNIVFMSEGIGASTHSRYLSAERYVVNKYRKEKLIAVVIIILLVGTIIPVNLELSSGSNVYFPQLLFASYGNNEGYVFESQNTYHVSQTNDTLGIKSNLGMFYLTRDLIGQNYAIDFGLKEFVNISSVSTTQILASNLFNVSVQNIVNIPSNSTYISPSYNQNIVNYLGLNGKYGYPSNLNYTSEFISNVSGNSYAAYNISKQDLVNKSLIFSEYVAQLERNETLLWQIKLDNVTYQSFLINSTLFENFYAGGLWHTHSVFVGNAVGKWHFLSINFVAHGLVSNFDGINYFMPASYGHGSLAKFSLGAFEPNSIYYNNYSLCGAVSPIFLLNSSEYSIHLRPIVRLTNGIQYSQYSALLNISIYNSNYQTVMIVNNHNMSINGSMKYISIGKLNNSNVGLEYYFHSVYFSTSSFIDNNFLRILIILTLYTPVFLGIVAVSNMKYKRREDH